MDKIIKKTQQDYIIIADKFRETRRKNNWVDLEPFLKLIKPKDKILDVGCGTARIYDQIRKRLRNKKLDYLGIDYVKPFLDQAKKDHPQAKFLNIDISKLKAWQKVKGKYDVILCIAVLHHFPTSKSQAFVLKEMRKRLKKDGLLILTVWNLNQRKFKKLHLKQIPRKILKGFKFKWLSVPFRISDGRKTTTQVNRFIYSFKIKELRNLLKKTGLKILEEKSNRNLCFLAKK